MQIFLLWWLHTHICVTHMCILDASSLSQTTKVSVWLSSSIADFCSNEPRGFCICVFVYRSVFINLYVTLFMYLQPMGHDQKEIMYLMFSS